MTAVDVDRAEWLEWRRHGIGASDVAAILGLSPYASPWSIWADKHGLLPEQADDEHMRAGRYLERAIGPWFEHETGLVVTGEQSRREYPANPVHRCTLDGVVLDHVPDPIGDRFADDSPLGGLEIKVTGPGRRWEEIPPHYQAQGQWQMHVAGLERVWFAVLHGRRLEVYELERDQADIDLMVARVDRFWSDHVVPGTPPPTDGHDATLRALAAVYPTHTPGTSVELDGRTAEYVVAAWEQAKQEKRDAEAEAQRHANALRAALGEAEEGTYRGARVVTLRTQTRTTRCPHCRHEEISDPFRVLRPVKGKE